MVSECDTDTGGSPNPTTVIDGHTGKPLENKVLATESPKGEAMNGSRWQSDSGDVDVEPWIRAGGFESGTDTRARILGEDPSPGWTSPFSTLLTYSMGTGIRSCEGRGRRQNDKIEARRVEVKWTEHIVQSRRRRGAQRIV